MSAVLRRIALRAFLAATSGLRGSLRLLDHTVGLGRVLFQPFGETLVGGLLHERAHRHVAQLGLRLTLELRVAQLDRDDRGDAFADVLAEKVLFLLLQQVLGSGVLVDDAGERGLEALDVHAAFDGGDAVGVAVDAFVVAGVPLDRDVERLTVGVVFVLEVGDLGEQRFLRRVEVLDEVDDAALVLERLVELALGPLVAEDDLEALVEEGHRLQALEHGAGDELGALGEEDRGVRPERDRRAGLARQRTTGRGVADDCELALRLAALRVLLLVALAILVDLDEQPLAERVDDADADAVEAAGDLVAVAAELAAGVQHGEHDLGRALALVRSGRVRIDRNAATVVVDADSRRRPAT